MLKCPYCQSETQQVKAGKQPSGSQRYKCQACQRRYTPEPREQGYEDQVRNQAVRLYLDGNNYRRIARLLQVSHTSVMNWVHAAADRLPPAPVPPQSTVIEEDELFTFVEQKKSGFTSSL